MTKTMNCHVIDQALAVAQTVALVLVEPSLPIAEKANLATTLDAIVRTIVRFAESDASGRDERHVEQIEFLTDKVLEALPELLALGDGYDLRDVDARLWVATYLVEALSALASSSLLSGSKLEWLSDCMHEQLTSTLRLAVRLTNPDSFEFGYVPNPWVQSGARAMNNAAQLARAIDSADAKARDLRAATGLAA